MNSNELVLLRNINWASVVENREEVISNKKLDYFKLDYIYICVHEDLDCKLVYIVSNLLEEYECQYIYIKQLYRSDGLTTSKFSLNSDRAKCSTILWYKDIILGQFNCLHKKP